MKFDFIPMWFSVLLELSVPEIQSFAKNSVDLVEAVVICQNL